MWRNSLDGNRDMFVSGSKDGVRFTSAAQLGKGHWILNACPMDGGEIASGPSGALISVWRRDKGVYYCRPGQTENMVGTGEQPTVAFGSKSVWIAWLSRRGGDLYLQRPGDQVNRMVEAPAEDPVLFSDGKANVGLVWTGKSGPMAMRVNERW
jgi:hypothetical protein